MISDCDQSFSMLNSQEYLSKKDLKKWNQNKKILKLIIFSVTISYVYGWSLAIFTAEWPSKEKKYRI